MFSTEITKAFEKEDIWLPIILTFDNFGNEIFVKETKNPDYYLTTAENNLLKSQAKNICDVIKDKCIFIEYGCGVCEKSLPFLDHLENPIAFAGLDFNGKILEEAKAMLSEKYPKIRFIPIIADFFDNYELPADLEKENRRVYYMSGSNIGMITEKEVLEFFKHIASIMGENGYFLCTFDYRKPKEVIERAYMTPGCEALIKNILSRMNRELGSNINIKEYSYRVELNDDGPALDFILTSKSNQVIKFNGKEYEMPKGKTIKTRVNKYKVETIHEYAKEAGLKVTGKWMDPKKLMMIVGMEKEDSV